MIVGIDIEIWSKFKASSDTVSLYGGSCFLNIININKEIEESLHAEIKKDERKYI